MEKAKSALMLFLASLPTDCYFNICSFGSRHELLYNKSVKNTTEIVNKTIEKVKSF